MPNETLSTIAAQQQSSSRTPHLGVANGDSRSPYLARIAVKSVNRIVIVATSEIRRLEADDNYVRIWADRPYLHKETLTHLVASLDPAEFLRVHRSHAVNLRSVRELRPRLHGEYLIVLADGTEITSGRMFRREIREAFGLARGGSIVS